jgi:hypothetical protein
MNKVLKYLLILLFPVAVQAQSQLSTYHLNRVVPAASLLNPAFVPKYKITVGLDLYAGAHTDEVSISDIFGDRDADGRYAFDEERFLSKLKDQNDLEAYANGGLFVGAKLGPGFASFSAGVRGASITRYSREFAEASLNGFNETGFELRDVGTSTLAFLEISGGYAYPVNDRLTVGARFKYLNGSVSAESNELLGSALSSGDSIFSLAVENLSISTAGFDAIDNGEVSELFFNGNTGFGFDFGATYRVNNRITVSASVIDIGRIKWEEQTTDYFVTPADYSFRGFDLLNLINDESEGDLIEAEIDSISNLFEFDELDGISYRSNLFTRFYIGGEYNLGIHRFAATFYGQSFPDRFIPGLGLSYSINFLRYFDLITGISLIDGNFDNLNLGFSMQFPGFQLYAMTDNVLGAIYPSRYSVVTAQFGISFNFGEWDLGSNTFSGATFSTNPYQSQTFQPKKLKKTKQKRQKANQKAKKRPKSN